MGDDFYVYLLVDHDPTDVLPDSIFYVGKGRNSRALQHVVEYVQALEQRDLDEARRLLLQAQHPEDSDEAVVDDQLEQEKLRRIGEARQARREVRIDVLRAGLNSATAYAVESVAIDVLGLDSLANKVAGHEHFRAPAVAVGRMLDAKPLTIEEPALQVTVAGVWGGASIAGLVDATDREIIWENARQSWSIGVQRRRLIERASKTDEPILLVAASKGPTRLWGGIVLDVWELAGTQPSSPRTCTRKDGTTYEIEGWAFVRVESVSPRLAELQRRWLQEPRRSTTGRQVAPTGIAL